MFTGVGFLGFGGSQSSRDAQQYIAKVDGEGLSRAAFEDQAREVTDKAGTIGNDQSFIRMLRRDVLFAQINNYLAYKFSQNIKASISNDQVKDYIRDQKVFFENGKFSNKKYLDLLANNGYTPDSYAEILRTALQQQQVVEAVINSTFVLPVDSELSVLKDETRTAYVAQINPSIVNMDDVVISPEDEQKYYDEHQSEFFKKERIKFNSVMILKQDIRQETKIKDDEVKQEYDNNSAVYTFPAKSSYSVIYVTSKDKADEIVNRLKTEKFDDVVAATNKDNVISPYGKNGSLGWFADDQTLPQPFKDAKLTEVGQISNPIAVGDGYVIVKLDGIQAAKKMDFDYAKYLIRSKLENQKVDNAFEQQEQKLRTELANKSESLATAAEKVGAKMETSNWVYFNDMSSVMRYPEVRDVAFGRDMLVDGKATSQISEIIPVGKDQIEGGVVIQVVDYRPEGIAPFEEVQQIIHRKIYSDIANERFNAAVDDIMKQLNETGDAKNVTFAKRYTLTRNSTEFPPKVVDMIFNIVPSVTKANTYGVQFIDNSAYIAVLSKVIPPTEQRDLSAELLPIFINDGQYNFLSQIRSKAKIEVMPDANL